MIPLRVILACLENKIVIFWGDSAGNYITHESANYSARVYGDLLAQIETPIIRLFPSESVIQTENKIIYQGV